MMPLDQQVTSSGNKQYSKIAEKAFFCVNKHLIMLISEMISSADKKLFDLAEKATSTEERTKFMDCTRIFTTEKNDISHHFFINLNNLLSVSKQNSISDDEELSLVGQDEMEEMVAITTMHSKAMNSFGKEISYLEARLEYLELMCEESIDKESLDPKQICEVFQKTIENIEMAIEVKLVFYKIFDQEVCSKLGVMYKAVNQVFIDNGVLPKIVLKTTKQEEIKPDEEVSTQVASYYDPTKNATTDFVPRSKEDFSHIVNEFMSGEMTITGNEIQLPESFLRKPTQQDLDGKNCYERKEVLKALSTLQHKITSLQKEKGSESFTVEQIKQELMVDISKQHEGVDKQVNLLDERSMDFVGMMFSAIVDDDTVSEIMTNLIYQLQLPVMKVAMLDSAIFEEDAHPARVTVDLLTAAGMGINLKEDRLYNELEEIVEHILDEFDIDIAIFEKAVDDLESIIKTEEQLTTETERQQQQQILQEHARDIVITQLKLVSCDKQIPNKIRPLVLKNWSTLMLNHYIRHGRNSEQWIQSVLLLRLLLKCIQPIKNHSQYNMVKEKYTDLLDAVNDQLYDTQQDKKDITNQVAELKSYFLRMIDDYGLKAVDENENKIVEEESSEKSTDTSNDELQHIQQQTEIAKQKIAQLSNTTKPGVWYEIYNGENKPVRRLKLSIILTDAAQLIFVDRKGLKVIEKDAGDFANELKENRSRMLADHSTFDQALGQVMKAIAA